MTANEREQIARLAEVMERVEEQVTDTAVRVRKLEDRALTADATRNAQYGVLRNSRALLFGVIAAAGAIPGMVALFTR